MRYLKRESYWSLLLLLVLIVHFLISLKLALYWYDHFNLGKFDLGNAVQVLHSTLRGKFFTYTDQFGTQLNDLFCHADFILLFFVPLFALFPDPAVLVVAQCLALSLGGLAVYLLGQELGLSKPTGFFIALAYLLNPEVVFLSLDAFHGITVAIPLILLTFYFFERYVKTHSRRNLWGLALFVFLILISKEQVSLLVFMLGLYAVLFRNERRLGTVLSATGLLWFAVYFFLVSPSFGPLREASIARFVEDFPMLVPNGFGTSMVRENFYLLRYAHLGSSYKDIILSPIHKPLLFVRLALNWGYLFRILAPLGFLSILSPAVLLLALPEYLINTLGGMTSVGYSSPHYVSLLIPVAFYAAILGICRLARLRKKIGKISIASLSSVLILGCSLFFSITFANPLLVNPLSVASRKASHYLEKVGVWRTPPAVVEEEGVDRDVYILNPKISGGAAEVYDLLKNRVGAVSGPDYLGAKLVVREDYNLFPVHWKESEYVVADLTRQPRSFRVLTLVTGYLPTVTWSDFLRESVSQINENPYGVLYSGNGLVVFERGGGRKLFEELPLLGESNQRGESWGIEVRDFVFPEELSRGSAASFELEWEWEEDGVRDGLPLLILVKENASEASFYEVAYGLFLSNAEKLQRTRQTIDIPTKLATGTYNFYLGWYGLRKPEIREKVKAEGLVKLATVVIK